MFRSWATQMGLWLIVVITNITMGLKQEAIQEKYSSYLC